MSNIIKDHSSQPERFCKYIHRYCNQTRLEGYDYCIRHILEDKSAPFKQCAYVNQPNKKRCTNAAPKSEKYDKRDNVLCPFHAKRAMLKVRISAPKKKPIEGPRAFLKSLEHYCKDPKHDPTHKRGNVPLNQNDVPLCKNSIPTTLSDVENAIEETLSFEEKGRVESIDDDFCFIEKSGDCLENAGVYTHKEVLTIAKEKIEHLQQLYIDELKVVYRELRENRRELLIAQNKMNKNKEDNETAQFQETDECEKEKKQAFKKFQRCSGPERALQHKAKQRHLNVDKFPVSKQLCTFEKLGIKCTNEAIVFTKFCKRHILKDPKQLLFKSCSYGFKQQCTRPVLMLEENSSCDLHFHKMLKSKINKPAQSFSSPETVSSKTFQLEPEPFQSMDDIASLGLDAIVPGSLFGLDQFGEPGESTDTVLSEDQTDLSTNIF